MNNTFETDDKPEIEHKGLRYSARVLAGWMAFSSVLYAITPDIVHAKQVQQIKETYAIQLAQYAESIQLAQATEQKEMESWLTGLRNTQKRSTPGQLAEQMSAKEIKDIAGDTDEVAANAKADYKANYKQLTPDGLIAERGQERIAYCNEKIDSKELKPGDDEYDECLAVNTGSKKHSEILENTLENANPIVTVNDPMIKHHRVLQQNAVELLNKDGLRFSITENSCGVITHTPKSENLKYCYENRGYEAHRCQLDLDLEVSVSQASCTVDTSNTQGANTFPQDARYSGSCEPTLPPPVEVCRNTIEKVYLQDCSMEEATAKPLNNNNNQCLEWKHVVLKGEGCEAVNTCSDCGIDYENVDDMPEHIRNNYNNCGKCGMCRISAEDRKDPNKLNAVRNKSFNFSERDVCVKANRDYRVEQITKERWINHCQDLEKREDCALDDGNAHSVVEGEDVPITENSDPDNVAEGADPICLVSGNKNINGVSISRPCWKHEHAFYCYGKDFMEGVEIGSCANIIKNLNCPHVKEEITEYYPQQKRWVDGVMGSWPPGGHWKEKKHTYSCPIETEGKPAEIEDCKNRVVCMSKGDGKEECFDAAKPPQDWVEEGQAEAGNSQDLNAAMIGLEISREAGNYMTDQADGKRIFTGVSLKCAKDSVFKTDCCDTKSGAKSNDEVLKGNYEGGPDMKGTLTGLAIDAGLQVGWYGVQVAAWPMFDMIYGKAVTFFAEMGMASLSKSIAITQATGPVFSIGFMGFTAAALPSTTTAAAYAASTILPNTMVVATNIGSSNISLFFNPWMFAIMVAIMVYMYLSQCEKEDYQYAMAAGANLCYLVKRKRKSRGVYTKEKRWHCCYNSVISRIINESARDQGVKKNRESCTGIRLDDLSKLDFGKMDFSEVVASLQKKINEDISFDRFRRGNLAMKKHSENLEKDLTENPNKVKDNYYKKYEADPSVGEIEAEDYTQLDEIDPTVTARDANGLAESNSAYHNRNYAVQPTKEQVNQGN